jgi:multidrug transporter EmrE-like cation transporter
VKTLTWIWLLGCAAAVVLANVVLRFAIDKSGVKVFSAGVAGLPGDIFGLLKTPLFFFAMALYAFAMLVWFRLVAIAPLSVAYPALACVTFVAISLAGVFVFSEQFSLFRGIGIVLMLSGLVLMSLS